MPTSRFSVSTVVPTPCLPPIWLSFAISSWPGSFSPLRLTGLPRSKPTMTTSASSGASSGRTAVTRQFAQSGSFAGSSISAPSWLMCQRFRSRL